MNLPLFEVARFWGSEACKFENIEGLYMRDKLGADAFKHVAPTMIYVENLWPA